MNYWAVCSQQPRLGPLWEGIYSHWISRCHIRTATRLPAPGQASPSLFCTRLMKSLSEGETDAVDHWLTDSASDWICFRLMTLMGWEHDGSLLLLITGTDYDSDQRWSLHAVCSEASWGSNVSWQRESRRRSCVARLLSLHTTYSLSRQVKA